MKTVGLRELKNNLSAYVRAARGGETVMVTDRGQAVVRLIAVESSGDTEKILDDMAARGELTRGKRLSTKEKAKIYSRRGPPLLKDITSAELLDALREDTV